MDRVKNAGRNAVWGMVAEVIKLGFPFLIRTIIIRSLGSEYLGLSSLFTSILQVLNLTELGFSSSIVYSLYKPVAEGDTSTVNAYLAFYRKVYTIIGVIILGCGFTLIPGLHLFIKGDIPAGINAYVLYIIYLINTAASYLLFAYKECILVVNQRKDVLSKIASLTKIIAYIVQVVILLVFKNYYLYAAILPILTIVYSCIVSAAVSKLYPQYHSAGMIGTAQKTLIKSQVSGLMVTKIAATTRNSFDSIIISSVLGLVSVANYGNYYYVMSSLQAILLIITNSMQAGIGNCVATESIEKNYNDYRNFLFIYSWISGVCTVCLYAFYQPFIVLWVGKDHLLSDYIVVLFTVYFFLLTMGDISSLYIDATGIWSKYRIKSILEALLNLVLNIFLVNVLGLAGVIIATLITRFVCGILWGNSILFKAYFGKDKIYSIYKDYIFYMLIVIISVLCVICTDRWVGGTSEKLHILKCICSIIFPNLLYYMAYRKTDRFQVFRKYFSRIIKIVKR